MADEVEMTPVVDAEPPKADPLAKPAATLKLNPVARPTAVGGAPSAGLKPGLKLPPKPGLASGLKLPPKPGAASTFKPGLKLPTQAAIKPGLKLPPKPVIHKPGEAVAAVPLPKPVELQKPVEMPKPMETLKSVTQKLKGITQEIPQQAILHKTGIIAEGGLSDVQKEAAKRKTARISLSDAMGVAPVKDAAAPMKTIRIKRPIDIPASTPAAASAAPAPAAPAAPAAAPAPTMTQRKTLKVSRPSGVAVRPGGKFSVKRPSQATTIAKTASAAAAAPAAPAADDAVADIPDMPATAAAPVPHLAPPEAESPSWVWTLSALVQLAACAVIGALAWFLYQNTQLATFCGGLGWGA